ncbi:hypothetical protein [Aerosakkonema sp. BLCC-F183]|uniref:hypothetical protein n=1 Tax=Aerosakkonema sp. BLCC-F183 TaxID=3342834 RepID=UPI0035BC5A5C
MFTVALSLFGYRSLLMRSPLFTRYYLRMAFGSRSRHVVARLVIVNSLRYGALSTEEAVS